VPNPVTVTGLGAPAGATILPVSSAGQQFKVGDAVAIGEGLMAETASIAGVSVETLTLATPLQHAHAQGEPVSPSARTKARGTIGPRRHGAIGPRRYGALRARRWGGSA
jgi:hypothetical protein